MHNICLQHTQTQAIFSHYCQPDAVQSPLTCSFSLISCYSLSYCPLFHSLLFSDSFNFGAAAHTDREQAQRVYGQPEGDCLPAQEKRGGLNKVPSQTGHKSEWLRHPCFADYLNCINIHHSCGCIMAVYVTKTRPAGIKNEKLFLGNSAERNPFSADQGPAARHYCL